VPDLVEEAEPQLVICAVSQRENDPRIAPDPVHRTTGWRTWNALDENQPYAGRVQETARGIDRTAHDLLSRQWAKLGNERTKLSRSVVR
jgi:hypothetical protein